MFPKGGLWTRSSKSPEKGFVFFIQNAGSHPGDSISIHWGRSEGKKSGFTANNLPESNSEKVLAQIQSHVIVGQSFFYIPPLAESWRSAPKCPLLLRLSQYRTPTRHLVSANWVSKALCSSLSFPLFSPKDYCLYPWFYVPLRFWVEFKYWEILRVQSSKDRFEILYGMLPDACHWWYLPY